LVVALKRAVGDGFAHTAPTHQNRAEPRTRIRVRTKKSVSPLLGALVGVMTVTLLFLTGLSYTYLKAHTARLYLEIGRCSQENKAISAQNEKLKLEAARLKSLERVEKIAQQKIGMVKNPQVEYLAMQAPGKQTSPAAAENVHQQVLPEASKSVSAGERLLKVLATAISEKGAEKKG